MRSSGSNDVVLDGVFVPESAISSRRRKGVWHPLFHAVVPVASPLIYSVYVGVAEAARDLALRAVPGAARLDPSTQAAAGEMETNLATARMALADMLAASGDARGADAAGLDTLATLMMPDLDAVVAPIVYAVPVQLLAYHAAVAKGTDVDQPRNLAKSVTVE